MTTKATHSAPVYLAHDNQAIFPLQTVWPYVDSHISVMVPLPRRLGRWTRWQAAVGRVNVVAAKE